MTRWLATERNGEPADTICAMKVEVSGNPPRGACLGIVGALGLVGAALGPLCGKEAPPRSS